MKAVGHKTNCLNVDLKEILPEELEAEVKEAAEISMGSEVCATAISTPYITIQTVLLYQPACPFCVGDPYPIYINTFMVFFSPSPPCS